MAGVDEQVKPKVRRAKAPAAEVEAAGPVVSAASAMGAMEKEIRMTTETVTETMTRSYDAVVPAIEKAAHDGLEQARATQEQVTAKMGEAMEQMMKSMTEMTEFARGNVEAMMASAKAAAAGAETLSTTMVETGRRQFEEAQAAWKAMTSARTPNELLTAQNDFAKAQFENTVAAWSHLSETMLKVSGDVVQPLSSRMAVAAETVKKAVAA